MNEEELNVGRNLTERVMPPCFYLTPILPMKYRDRLSPKGEG
jgi:hypothetical protein